MRRRTLLELALATPLLACSKGQPMTIPSATTRMPSIFLAHGSPFLLDDAEWVAELGRWARALPKPKSILMISAHWVDAPITIGATRKVPLTYDFYGFPARYYQTKYAAPGAPDLARRVRELVGTTKDAPERGLDHGAYIPLVAMYPEADVPVLQISIPTMDASALLSLGRTLAPLRDEGVLVVGSGFLTHNMRSLQFEGSSAPPSWATEFDAWSEDAVRRRDEGALATYRTRAPGVDMALPTHEHFVPVLVSTGTSLGSSEPVSFPIAGFTYGSFTKRSVQFG